jgi:hypothetical protein
MLFTHTVRTVSENCGGDGTGLQVELEVIKRNVGKKDLSCIHKIKLKLSWWK